MPKVVEFHQSRLRDFVSRLYRYSGLAAASIFGVSAGALFLREYEQARIIILMWVIFAPSAAILIALWLMLFNAGRSGLPSLKLVLDEVGVHVNRFGLEESIHWENFSSVTVSPRPFKTVALKSKGGKRIKIDYCSLPKDQWSQILSILRLKEER